MACADIAGDYGQALIDGSLFEAIYCVFSDQLGAALAVLLIMGGLALSRFSTDGSPVPLVVTLMIVGAMFVSQLPAGITQFIAILLLFVIPGGIWLIIQRVNRVS